MWKQAITVDKFNKKMAYTVVPATGNSKLLFSFGNFLFRRLKVIKCQIQKIILQKIEILQYLRFLARRYSKQHFAKGNTVSYKTEDTADI